MIITAQLFLIALVLNIAWEFSHCWLYETCRRQSWRQNIPLLLTMAVKDAGLIVLFTWIAVLALGGSQLVVHSLVVVLFVIMALGFSFVDERLALRWGRWEYAAVMPKIGGVGITPLLELAVTGGLALLLVG